MNKHQIVLIVGLIFIAFNLRAPITSVGSLAALIRDDLGISNGIAGLITTVPLIAFALVSPFIPRLSSRFGIGRTMLAGLILVLIGECIRSYTNAIGVYIGTAFMGVGIATGNVLVPAIIKQRFPSRVGLLTSIYTTAMGIFAGIAAGISVPLALDLGLGWRTSLAVWAGLTLITALVWLPQTAEDAPAKRQQTAQTGLMRELLRSPLAWQVTCFMGLQSLLYYCMVAWLPSIVQSHGLTIAQSGYMALLYQFISLPASFFVPLLVDKYRDQRKIATCSSLLYLCGMLCLLAARTPFLITLAVALCGIGAGSSISLAMCFFGLRTINAQQASQLSGMAQSIGYILAAIGPFLMGAIFDATASWTIPILIFIIALLLLTACGLGAGKDQQLLPADIPSVQA